VGQKSAYSHKDINQAWWRQQR